MVLCPTSSVKIWFHLHRKRRWLRQPCHQLYVRPCGITRCPSSKPWPSNGVTEKLSISSPHPSQSLCLPLPVANRPRASSKHWRSVSRISPSTPLELPNWVLPCRHASSSIDQHQVPRDTSLCHVPRSATGWTFNGITWSPTPLNTRRVKVTSEHWLFILTPRISNCVAHQLPGCNKASESFAQWVTLSTSLPQEPTQKGPSSLWETNGFDWNDCGLSSIACPRACRPRLLF
mmetsp:Transcript_24266/g.47717  ORF Transcript_24266/g.47717 Transcript_24266/m.47717 type:complete len:232 (+) Transcript_24266:1182-1877(+)